MVITNIRMRHYLILLLFGLTAVSVFAQSNAPANLKATSTAYNKVVLAWDDKSTNETRFEIERKDTGGFNKIGEVNANIITYTDNTVSGSGTYVYRIKAIFVTNANYSNELTVNTPTEPPTTPTNLAASVQGANLIRVTWINPGAGSATDFLLERGNASGGPFNQIAVVPYSRTPTYDDNLALSGTQYCYRVRARGPGGTSNFSNVDCKTTPTAPSNIKNLTAKATGSSSIRLTWDKYGKESPIDIERRTGQTGGWSKVASTLADNGEYTDNGLNANTEYCYRIGQSGTDYSPVACATTQQNVPNAPARLMVSAVSSSQINLQWADLSDNETGFQIERADSPTAPFTKIADPGQNATTYSDQNLSASKQYCYRVRAVNSVGPSGYTSTECATTPAPPVGIPQNLVAVAASTTQINLTWNGVSGATSYQLERSPNGNDPWTKLADPAGNTTSYEDKNLTPNTRYYYRIRAVINGNAGDYSNRADATTPDVPPAAPARLVATAVAYNQINLQWADVSTNESGFQVERSPNGNDPWTKIADLGQNATTYSDQSVQPQTQYFYRVRAINTAGPSGYSDPANATTPVGPPGKPQNLVATAVSTTQINLTWTAIVTASNVLIERSPNGNDNWNQIADVPGTTTTYEDKNLSQNTRYYYRIRAKNASGTGLYSDSANAMTPDAPPVAPARLVATAISFSQINLTWADLSNNESGFELERSPNGTDGWTKITDLPANATSYEDKNRAPRTRYYYRIRAINAAGPSPYSNVADATTPDSPPAAPARLTATAASNSQINLVWADGPDNETGFKLERSLDGNTWTKIADLPANATTYQNTGLTPNTRYFYRVRAVNAVGQSGYSNVADETTPDVPPAAPARLMATAVPISQINLAWADLSNNERGFEVERSSSATGSFTNVASLPANTTSYEDKNLTDNTQYCYRVRAVNPAGPSAYTDPVCATTPLAPPATPGGLTAQVFDYDQIKLNWTPLGPKAVTVIIERATDPNGPFTEIKQQPAGQTGDTDMGLKEFTTYYYRIKAVNAAGMSGYSNVTSARVEEIIIAVEDELETHTTLLVSDRRLHIITNWFGTLQTTIHLHSATGQPMLTDNRKVRPADRWEYALDALPAGIYIVNIVADGRKLAKRILLP